MGSLGKVEDVTQGAMHEVLAQVHKLRLDGLTYAKIDEELGFPKQWLGRGSWVLDHKEGNPTPRAKVIVAAPVIPGNGSAPETLPAAIVAPVEPVSVAESTPERARKFCPECGRRHNQKRRKRG